MSYVFRTLMADEGNMGGRRAPSSVRYLVYHYTANDGDTAMANARYFARNRVAASARYFVDDAEVVRSVPEERTAWAVGGRKWDDCADTGGGAFYGRCVNANSISIEMCDTARD